MSNAEIILFWIGVCLVITMIIISFKKRIFSPPVKKHKLIKKQVQISEEDIQFVNDFIHSAEEIINKLEEKRKSIITSMGINYQYLLKDYYQEFKENIITQIIKYLGGQNLEYNYKKYINKNDFGSSNLFRNSSNYKGDDLITGEINSLKFQCSELHVSHTTKGRNSTTYAVFHGLFFVIDLPINIDKKKRFGTNSNFGSEILLDNTEFNELFKVFGNDSTEVFYILSSKVIEKMVNFVRKTGHNFQFSFKENKLYIAIESGLLKRFFEPPIFTSLWDYKVYDEIVMDFKLIFELLNQLEFRRSLS